MTSDYNSIMDAMRHNSKRLQMAAWYMLMEGADRTLNDVGEIVNKAWDGKKWQGDDNQFGEILANMLTMVVASKRISPPDFIEKQHQQLIESNEHYIKFLIAANMGKSAEATIYFDKCQVLRNACIAAIQAVESALE